MFAAIGLMTSVVSAMAGMSAAEGQARAAELNAENIETEKLMNDVVAYQRSNDRFREYELADSANRALMGGSMGRDLGEDRSVQAFLNRNRETVGRDMQRIDVQRNMEGLKLDMQAASERRRASDIRASGTVNAFTTIVGGLMNYQDTRFAPSRTGGMNSTSLSSSMRPLPNPRY